MRTPAKFALLAALAVLLAALPAKADRLEDFENNVGNGDRHERGGRHHRGDDYDDSVSPLQVLFDILLSAGRGGGEPATGDVDNPNSKSHLSAGASYMYVEPGLFSAGGWVRMSYEHFGIDGEYLQFNEDLGSGRWDTMGLGKFGLTITAPRTERFYLAWELMYRFLPDSDLGAAGPGVYGEYKIIDPLYFEVHADVAFFPNNPMWDMGAYLKVRKWAGLKVGYRTIIAGDENLSGPEVGVMFEF